MNQDTYMVLADFEDYTRAQSEAGSAYQDRRHWTEMSILNTARSGTFSSDRAIKQYCEDIWKVPTA
jgi:starch phosphorylase